MKDDIMEGKCCKCGGTAYMTPFPQPYGMCLCANCTFGDKTLTLGQMVTKIYREALKDE